MPHFCLEALKPHTCMKRFHFFLTFAVISGLYILLVSNANGRATAANSGNTGAPGEATICGNCHNSTSFGTVTAQIQVFLLGTTTPALAYVPGVVYDLRVTVNNTSGNPVGRGFQMTCLRVANNAPLAGYSNLAANVKQITLSTGAQAGRTYVEHNGVTTNNQFNFRWTAPAAGLGSVRFYAAGNAVNGNSSTSGDSSGSSNLTLPEAQPIAATGVVVHPLCFGQFSGSINQTITAGVAPFSFLWNDGATGEDRSGLGAGTFSVEISDALGQSFSAQYTLTAPSEISHQANATNAIVPGGLGSVVLSATGGTGTLNFNIGGIGSVSQFPLQIPAGTYTYQVTDSNDCTAGGSFQVTAPQPLVADVVVNNVSCFGENDGSLVLNGISGATEPYTIDWSTGGANTDLGPDVYFLSVTDDVGYVQIFSFQIIEPPALSMSVDFSSIACFGQQSTVVVSPAGGTLPYAGAGLFSVAAGENSFLVTDANGCSAETVVAITQPDSLALTSEAPALPCIDGEGEVVIEALGGVAPYSGVGFFPVSSPGIYLFTVSDANGCISEIEVEVAALDGPTIEITTAAPSCFGSCDGSAAVILTNAADPVTALWSNGSTAFFPDDLCAGINSVTITDALGCILNATVNVPGVLPVDMDFAFDPILCFGGTTQVSVIPTGGTPLYQVTWMSGNSENTSAGQYVIQVIDANGCQYEEELFVSQPALGLVEGYFSSVTCFGANDGIVGFSAFGGTQPFIVVWDDGTTANPRTGLAPAAYSGVISDGNGCQSTLVFEIDEPEVLEVQVTEVIVQGDFASLQLSIEGGTAPYSTEIIDSEGNIVGPSDLPYPGTYTITVTDANGCPAVVENFVLENSILQAESAAEDVLVYPNPVRDRLQVVAPDEITEWMVMTSQGTVISKGKGNGKTLMLDTTTWPKGIYWIKMARPSGISVERVVKL